MTQNEVFATFYNIKITRKIMIFTFLLTTDYDNLAELQGLPAKMPKIKKLTIFTFSTTSRGIL